MRRKLYYKIGEACKLLEIQPYVLRYWETEFPALTPSKSRSGQRVYSEKELEIIRRIKELLYEEGYTIAGAKKKLEGEMAAGGAGEALRDDDEDAANISPETSPGPVPEEALAPQPAQESPAPLLVASAALDTDAPERIQTLLSGIEEALQEARDILDLLGPKSP